MDQLRWLGLYRVSGLSGERRRSRFQRRSLCLKRLGRLKVGERIVRLASGWQWATDGRSSRAYYRARFAGPVRGYARAQRLEAYPAVNVWFVAWAG